jgi:NAD(P)-dependent dehydrogenase (short-subunit alcohol dehydrogenase family)
MSEVVPATAARTGANPVTPLHDTVVAVTGRPGAVAAGLTEHLRALGAAVGGAVEKLGAADALVHVASVAPELTDRALVDVDAAEWDRTAEAPIREALGALQQAHAAMAARGGAIVTVVPSIALTGAPGLAAFASAAEGIRLLTKSAARQWGVHGIRVNAVVLPVAAWAVEQPDEHVLPSKFGPSLPGSDALAEAAGAIAFLVGGLARGVTGSTVVVDAGTLMVP